MLHTMGDDAFDIIMKVHVRAPFRLIRAAAPYLRIKGNKENRSIVNVSSTSGLHGNVGQVNYAAVRSLSIARPKYQKEIERVFAGKSSSNRHVKVSIVPISNESRPVLTI